MADKTVNIIGTGYIGSLIALHLADKGYRVMAVDKDEEVLEKERWFNRYDDIGAEATSRRLEKIETTTSYDDIQGSTSIVCVNTPPGDESADISNVKASIRELGSKAGPEHRIILRSTIPPGTCRSELLPLLEESGLELGKNLHFCYSPEFIRGGTGLKELRDPSKMVLAGDEKGIESFKQLFPLTENLYHTGFEEAEAVKYFDNAFHGLKISLANECGRLGEELGFEPSKVMEIISSDYRLNISDVYMTPGASYGGPCLEKDIEILQDEAKGSDTETPVISSINQSNEEHNSWLVEKINDREPGSVALIGATYKEGFNSLTNSPSLKLAESLDRNDHQIMIYEPEVDIEEFRQVDAGELNEADIWIVFNKTEDIENLKEKFDGDIIDLQDFSF